MRVNPARTAGTGFHGRLKMSIKWAIGTILGTFDTYFHDRRTPTREEKIGVEHLAAAAELVVPKPAPL